VEGSRQFVLCHAASGRSPDALASAPLFNFGNYPILAILAISLISAHQRKSAAKGFGFPITGRIMKGRPCGVS
jgi:hypothetical protein